jgi:choline dehydrogenase-like flavoprotein
VQPYDVCIIGSGAGGGAAAYGLTRAGYKVIVLEKGPYYHERDFTHDEVEICRRDFFVPSVFDEPHVVVRDGEPSPTSDGWISCCVGGGTVHMSGFFFRMRPDDFRVRSLRGPIEGASLADWPFGYETLAPYYDEVERTIGVSGDAALEERATPYPLAPLLAHPSATLVEDAGKKLGHHVFPTPRAIVSADYAGRKACAYCGFCGSYGCEVGAKSSSLATFIALAEKTGKLTLRPRAHAIEILTDARGRANGVVYLDERDEQRRVNARVIVVACSPIETARLLLSSGKHGLANGSGLVGKNLMFSTASAGWARFSSPSPHFPKEAERLPFIDRTVRDARGTILFMRPHVNPIFQAERLAERKQGGPIFGAALKRALKAYFVESHTLEWETFSEFFPSDQSEVTLDPEVKDRHGRAVARYRYAVHPGALGVSDALAKIGAAVLDAAGAKDAGVRDDERTYPMLQAGTTRMGKDPKSSVIDPTGRAHDVPNLYVADGSGFPSTSGAPFTLSIMANALRVAGEIVKRGAAAEL